MSSSVALELHSSLVIYEAQTVAFCLIPKINSANNRLVFVLPHS